MIDDTTPGSKSDDNHKFPKGVLFSFDSVGKLVDRKSISVFGW